MQKNWIAKVVFTTVACTVVLIQPTRAAASSKCHLTFNLSGWSAFYKTASGSGTITCDDGQSARVSIQTTGGGLTAGKSKITNGRGTFSEVDSIGELFGSYAAAEAHAGAVVSSDAQVVTKGTVSLALSGTGEGIDLGFAFGKFTLRRKK